MKRQELNSICERIEQLVGMSKAELRVASPAQSTDPSWTAPGLGDEH